jgi:hypothetical protein
LSHRKIGYFSLETQNLNNLLGLAQMYQFSGAAKKASFNGHIMSGAVFAEIAAQLPLPCNFHPHRLLSFAPNLLY